MMRITERSLRSRLSRSSSKLQMWKRSCSAPSSLTRESQKLIRGNGSVLEQPFSLCQLLGSQGLKWFPNQNFVECVGGDRLMCHEDSISEDGSSSGATSTGSPKKRRCF